MFAEGIEHTLQMLGEKYTTGTNAETGETRKKMIDLLSRAVGASILSRACSDDSALADDILEVCRAEMIVSLPVDDAEQV